METQWKPKGWVAVLFGLFAQPFNFLYINRPVLFWVYLILSIIAIIAQAKLEVMTSIAQAPWFSLTISLILVGAIHGFLLARNYDVTTKRRWFAGVKVILALWLGVLLMQLSLRVFFIEPFIIPSGAMKPTLPIGSHVLVSKLGYHNYRMPGLQLAKSKPSNAPDRGDIIVFQNPENPQIDWIKRVVGKPGETVIYRDKQLFIRPSCQTKPCPDAQKVMRIATDKTETNYIGETQTFYQESLGETQFDILINHSAPDLKQYWLNQSDSREGEWRVPPGHYFVMGDQRDNSRDSRFIGFIPEENIIGKVFAVW